MRYPPSLSICTGQPSLDMASTCNSAPPNYVQPYADTSWIAVEVQGCHEMMMKNLTLRHLL